MVISILEHCMKIGAKVLTVKDGYELGDNVQSKILAFAFGLVAELEREMISKRTKEALQRRKMNGQAIGRQKGAKNKRHVLDGKEDKIIALLNAGVAKTNKTNFTRNCRILKKSFTTIANISKIKLFFATAMIRMKAIPLNISR